MRYMLLIYNKENQNGPIPEQGNHAAVTHAAIMDETARLGIFRAAEPLHPTSTATTVRVDKGKVLTTDGPFAETKEQLAGYYILDCKNLDEAIEWAAKIPTACSGGAGCVEIRPIRDMSVQLRDNIRETQYATP